MVIGPALRLVFFGTPAFAVPTLNALLQARHIVVGVVTRADRARGRGQKTSDTPVKTRALAAGVPVLQPERLNDPAFLEALAGLRADLGVVAAYGKILTDTVLTTPRLGLINVHASLLPRYRGAAPVHRAVIAGDKETGVTIMRMVKALDAGPMIATARRPIGADETSDQVERDLATLGASLLLPVVDALSGGAAVPETPQEDAASTYAPRLTREDGRMDWTRPAATLHNLIRGLHPWPHAFTFHRGNRLILLRSQRPPESDVADDAGQTPPVPVVQAGVVVSANGDAIRVATGDGILAVTELQAEGRRALRARDFLAGHAVEPGDLFTTAP